MNHPGRYLLPFFLPFLLLSSCTLYAQSSAVPLGRADSLLLAHGREIVDTLTSPAMYGRGYYRGGAVRAAVYLADQFRNHGMHQVGDSWFQLFPLEFDSLLARPHLSIDGVELAFGRHFIVSPKESRSDSTLEVISVGSGIVADGLDELKGKEIEGRMVIIEPNLPEALRERSDLPEEEKDATFRIQRLISRGAAAVIRLVDRPAYGDFYTEWDRPVFDLQRDQLPSSPKYARFILPGSRHVETAGLNVIGLLPGTGRHDAPIMICAHYDHLGGIDDSLYFPGANDNASGVALMLALAERFQSAPLEHDVLFVAFGGEEMGLLGSAAFAFQPPVELRTIRFLLNIDMAASGWEGIMAVGGKEFPEDFRRLQEIGEELGLPEIRKRENAPNSDHWFLLKKGVPGFYIYPFVGHQPYHHIDDLPTTLEWSTFVGLGNLLEGFLRRID